MSVYKDEKQILGRCITDTPIGRTRFTKLQNEVFRQKREALAWEREQLNKVETDLDMSFESFIDIYTADMKNQNQRKHLAYQRAYYEN